MDIDQTYKASVSGLKGNVRLVGTHEALQVLYPRYTKLGAALLSNAGQQRAVLANYIRQDLALCRSADNMAQITFIAVV